MSVESPDTGGRIRVRQSPLPEADVDVDGDRSLVQLHQVLVDGLDDAIVAALRECPGDRRDDHRRALRDAGVDALDGRLAAVLATLAAATDREADAVPADAWQETRSLLDRLGSGHVDGQESSLDDVRAALPPLLAATTSADATPTVLVRLGVGWASRRRRQREDVLTYLATLATGVDLRLVVSEAAADRILDDHVASTPGPVLTRLRNRRSTDSHTSRERREAVDEAVGSLSPDGRPAAVLAALADSPTDSLDYDTLARALALDGRPYEAVRRLDVDHALVERTERADGTSVVSIRPAGYDVLDALDGADRPESGRSSAAPSRSSPASPGSRGASHTTPQISPAMPCCPAAWDGPPDPPGDRDGAADERPPEAADAAADGDRTDRYEAGLVWPRYGDRAEWVPALASVNSGEVALVDADLSGRLDEDRDGRQPHVSYVEAADEVVVGAEYHNPMQFATAAAHALTCEQLWATDDWGDRIGEDLRGLDVSARPVLWSATCLGWLPSDVEDGDDYVDALRDARDDLLALSRDAGDEESDVDRTDVTRHALGLLATVVQVFDLLGVETTIEMRVPECSRHYSAHGNGERREDLVEHIGMLTSLTSRVGAFSAHRQLFEDREDRRSDAFTPGFESGDSPRRGVNRAGIVVVGNGADSLAGDVVEAVESPLPLHEDAPPIGVDVDVVEDVDGGRMRETTRRMLRSRGLGSTPTAESIVAAVVRSPWAAAEAVHQGLATESTRRDVYPDEVRRALSTLDEDRLLPDAAPSARAGVAALVAAEDPISQAELARRADISTASWRTHRDALVDADLVRETSEGWRLALPFREERGADVEAGSVPWYLCGESSRAGDRREVRKPTDVLDWLVVEQGVGDVEDLSDPSTDLGRAFETVEHAGAMLPRGAVDVEVVKDVLAEMGLPPDVLLAGCGGSPRSPSTSTVAMGESTRQTSLT